MKSWWKNSHFLSATTFFWFEIFKSSKFDWISYCSTPLYSTHSFAHFACILFTRNMSRLSERKFNLLKSSIKGISTTIIRYLFISLRRAFTIFIRLHFVFEEGYLNVKDFIVTVFKEFQHFKDEKYGKKNALTQTPNNISFLLP